MSSKRKYTFTLDSDLVESIRSQTDNLSQTVTMALKEFMRSSERQELREQLQRYAASAAERHERLGLFSDDIRKFL